MRCRKVGDAHTHAQESGPGPQRSQAAHHSSTSALFPAAPAIAPASLGPWEGYPITAAAAAPATSLIRWHYLWYVGAALAIMIVVIVSHQLWWLNFVHVFSGLLWTGIDLFMGFVLGPILRVIDLSARKAVLLQLTPRTLFLMPALSIITGTTGWYLAQDMGFTALSWPQYGWVAAALVLVALMTLQGLGYLLPMNLRVCFELQRDVPDNARIARLTNHYFLAIALQGAMQILTIIVMARLATGV